MIRQFKLFSSLNSTVELSQKYAASSDGSEETNRKYRHRKHQETPEVSNRMHDEYDHEKLHDITLRAAVMHGTTSALNSGYNIQIALYSKLCTSN